jgi:hypothetical protein
MCLSGTVAQVVGTPLDYADIYGIAMVLTLNDPSGTSAPYDAMAAGVKAFTFDVSGLPTGLVRVEFGTPATDPSGDSWSYTLTGNGPTTVDLSTLVPSFAMPNAVPFDPSQIESITFHMVSNATSPFAVANFCISKVAVTACQ